MQKESLFINGVYEEVLTHILKVQSILPEQILYLQPYASDRIVKLSENPPSVDEPVRLFISLTHDLPTVHYTCEIVGWDDKRVLEQDKHNIIKKVIETFQPTEEGGIYLKVREDGPACVNLLHIRRLKKLAKSFRVDELTKSSKSSNQEPVSPNRTTAGGWVYVYYQSEDWLNEKIGT